jgi:LmbE family N-acetylglucosaminyl deacetylase
VTDARRVAFAMACHPDDIEFAMAGTLLLLRDAGFEIHYMNVANGSCGTATTPREEIIRIREQEARAAAALAGAIFHESVTDDLTVYYEHGLLAKVGAVVRRVNPQILLIPSLQDYMEDHANTARVAVTAAFCRGMLNVITDPPVGQVEGDVTLYHAMPHGLRDAMRFPIVPEMYVDVASVIETKARMLAEHRSQKDWLDVSQGLGAYVNTMKDMSAEVGAMSGRFEYAEGWRRHSHLGFCAADADPLADALKDRVAPEPAYAELIRPHGRSRT